MSKASIAGRLHCFRIGLKSVEFYKSGGGLAVVSQGRVLADLALPIAGLVSTIPADKLSLQFQQIRGAMDEIVDWEPPYLVFKACFGASLVCNSGPHLSDVGIVDTELDLILKTPTDNIDEPVNLRHQTNV